MESTSNLDSLKPLEIEACKNITDLIDLMSEISFGGREVGRAWTVLKTIVNDQDCGLVLTLSGALTIAKLGRIFGDLISRSIVDAVITTGALVTHSFVEELGMYHYKAPNNLSDKELCKLRLNRIFDSIEPESNLDILEQKVCDVFSKMDASRRYASFEIIHSLASMLLNSNDIHGLLHSILQRNVNVYVPAFIDSELGLYLFHYNEGLCLTKKNKIVYDPMRDLAEYSNWIRSKKRIALLTLGGGVPRNWSQQMLPFLKSKAEQDSLSISTRLPEVVAAIRICPDREDLGHLSGSTYSEGISWGKFTHIYKDNLVEIKCDASIIFPFLAKALIDYIDEKRK